MNPYLIFEHIKQAMNFQVSDSADKRELSAFLDEELESFYENYQDFSTSFFAEALQNPKESTHYDEEKEFKEVPSLNLVSISESMKFSLLKICGTDDIKQAFGGKLFSYAESMLKDISKYIYLKAKDSGETGLFYVDEEKGIFGTDGLDTEREKSLMFHDFFKSLFIDDIEKLDDSKKGQKIGEIFFKLRAEKDHVWVEDFQQLLKNPGFFLSQICPYKLEYLSHFTRQYDEKKHLKPSSVFLDFFRKNNFDNKGFFFKNIGVFRQFLRYHARNIDYKLGLNPLSIQKTIPHANEHLYNALTSEAST